MSKQARWIWGTIGAVLALVFLRWLLGQEGLAAVLRTFAWPVLIGWLTSTFREPLNELLVRLIRARLPGGTELEFGPKFDAIEPAGERLSGADEGDAEQLLEGNDGRN